MEESFNSRLDKSIEQIRGFEKLNDIKDFYELKYATKGLITQKNQQDAAVDAEESQALTHKWNVALFNLGIAFARFTKINPHKVSFWIITELSITINNLPKMAPKEAMTTYTALNIVAKGIIGGLSDNADYKDTIKSINNQLDILKNKITNNRSS